MQLTQHTDYSLRVLAYLSLHSERLVTISEIADFFAISRNHLVKIVHNLAQHGYIDTQRGKNGGMQLARPPERITVGEVVRQTEPGFALAECFNPTLDACAITSDCGLKAILMQARDQFLATLDKYTIADAIRRRGAKAAQVRIDISAIDK